MKYQKVELSEQQLEDLVRRYVNNIEEGLKYITHQNFTDSGRLDVLMVDSGNSLVVAELKVVENDSMLMQAIDYYDYLSTHIEAIARLYKKYDIDPRQTIRLFLIAPSFSQSLINRCKWIDVPISLFSYQCLKIENAGGLIPIFMEQSIPSPPEVIETHTLDDRLGYITDNEARESVYELLKEISDWEKDRIVIEPIKYAISLKVDGRVFAYICPRRKHFIIETYNEEGKWTGYPVHKEEDLEPAKGRMKVNFDKKSN